MTSRTQTEPPPERGAITFYSFKGGTGRSMALANIACILAQRSSASRDVLMIDWDLEAPGLHHYFRDRLTNRFGKSANLDQELDAQPGLLDLMWTLAERFAVVGPGRKDDAGFDEEAVERVLVEVLSEMLPAAVLKTDVPALSLLKAGAHNPDYSRKVNSMPWENLYHRAPGIFRILTEQLADRYAYVLIDSRTGFTDVSGICTMLMPEKLVLVFTPNRQSLKGVLDLARRAITYRKKSGELRPLMIYPLASRIEDNETDRKTEWRQGNPTSSIEGYQPLFERLFEELYAIGPCHLGSYFDVASIRHVPRYAYGEEIATLVDRPTDQSSSALSYDNFTTRLTGDALPWEDPAQVAERLLEAERVRNAQRLFASLLSDQQVAAKRAFLRMVRPGTQQEGGNVPVSVPVGDLGIGAGEILKVFVSEGLVTVHQSPEAPDLARFSTEGLVRSWPQLQQWFTEDADFLRWRESLRSSVINFKAARASGAKPEFLTGAKLREAENRRDARPDDLTGDELSFINECRRQYNLSEAVRLAILATTEISRGNTADSLRRGLLLAAESLSRTPTIEGDDALRDGLALLARPLLTLPLEHPDEFVSGSADGCILAAVSNASVRLWNIETGIELAKLERDSAVQRSAVAISRTGKRAAFATAESIWLWQSGSDFTRLRVQIPPDIRWLRFDCAETALFLAFNDGGICRLNLDDLSLEQLVSCPSVATFLVAKLGDWICIQGEEKDRCFFWTEQSPRALEEYPINSPVTAATLAPNRHLLAFACSEQATRSSQVQVWDREKRSLIHTSRQTETVNDVLFGPDSDSFVTLAGRRGVQIHAIHAKRNPWRLRQEARILRITASSDAGLLALSGEDGSARVLEFESGRERTRVLHDNAVRYVSFVAGGKRLITASYDRTAQVSSVESQGEQIRFSHSDTVWDIEFSPDGKWAVTAGSDRSAVIWDLRTGRERLRLTSADLIGSAAFSPDGSLIAISGMDNYASVFNSSSGDRLCAFQFGDNVPTAAFSPDGRYLLTASWDTSVRVFDISKASEIVRFGANDVFTHAIFNPSGVLIAAACEDATARVWDLSGNERFHLVHPAAVRAVAFHPSKQFLATACVDGIARIFDLERKRDPAAEFVHAPELHGVVFSPDGKHLATASDDGTARIWNAESRQQVSHVRHDGVVNWASFSPDGNMLATASEDKTARLWLWRTEDLIQEVHNRTRRGLNPEEWAQYFPDEPYPNARDEHGFVLPGV